MTITLTNLNIMMYSIPNQASICYLTNNYNKNNANI